MNRVFPVLVLLLVSTGGTGAEDPNLDKVRKAIATKLPGVEAVTPSAVPGLYQLQKGQSFAYVTGDGRYLIQGDMVDLVTGELITEKQRRTVRLAALKEFGPKSVIEFAPKKPKYTVTVFTDIDCGYCRKLHSEMSEYHDQGIAVRYLFFPRSGPDTESFSKAESVWCSKDRKEALTQAKLGLPIKAPSTCSNPILKHYETADALGVDATPTMILPNGEVVRGYVPAAALASRLATGDWRQAQSGTPAP